MVKHQGKADGRKDKIELLRRLEAKLEWDNERICYS